MRSRLFIFCILLSFAVSSQNKEGIPIYAKAGLAGGSYTGGQIGLSAGRISFEYYSGIRKAATAPSDLTPGFLEIFTFGASMPYDHIESARFLFTPLRSSKSERLTRFKLNTGISFLQVTEAYNFKKQDLWVITSNYSFDYKKKGYTGVVAGVDLDLVFSSFLGMSVSPVLEVAKNHTVFNIHFNLMLGKLN